MLLQQHGFAVSVTRNLPLVTVCLLSHVFQKKNDTIREPARFRLSARIYISRVWHRARDISH